MSPTEAAYFAGFVDGEGTIGVIRARRSGNKVGYRLQPYLAVANTDFAALERIQEMCGNGRLMQQTNPATPHHKPGYTIRLSPDQIRHVLPQIRPYLLIKAKQADYLMEFLSIHVSRKRPTEQEQKELDRLRDAVCTLNARGVKVSEAVN